MTKFFRTVLTGSPAGTGTADATYINADTPADPVDVFYGIEGQLDAAAPSGSPTTPTLDVIVQATHDGTNWWTVLTFTQKTTGAGVEQKQALRTASVSLGTRYRVKASVGTASGTATYAISVTLLLWSM